RADERDEPSSRVWSRRELVGVAAEELDLGRNGRRRLLGQAVGDSRAEPEEGGQHLGERRLRRVAQRRAIVARTASSSSGSRRSPRSSTSLRRTIFSPCASQSQTRRGSATSLTQR